jgi:hypothetical protein
MEEENIKAKTTAKENNALDKLENCLCSMPANFRYSIEDGILLVWRHQKDGVSILIDDTIEILET